MRQTHRVFSTARLLPLFTAAALAACGDSDSDTPDAGPGDDASTGMDSGTPTDAGTNPDAGGDGVPTTYSFESRFNPGESSVVYTGQVFRQVLIADLKKHITNLTDRIDNGTLTPTTADVVSELSFYFRFDGDTSSDVELLLDTEPAARQTVYGDISSGTTLVEKVAGNDEVGQHEDWTTAFVGWDAPGVTTPESLVLAWFQELETLAIRRANGDLPLGPDNAPIGEVYVNDRGHDLAQLVQKFLGTAIPYSQGTDDYLDDDIDGKGLNSDHSAAANGKPYTELEHAWDEGFGYFGAARDYGDYTDDEIAGKGGRPEYGSGYHDTNGDGAIDLTSEYNFGHSQNAAKRDRGSAAEAKTDFTKDAFDGFLKGRAILAHADGPLSEDEMRDLKAARDRAVTAWEKAIAATIVHYINNVIRHMATFGTADYDYLTHAKEWSEMKGFALGLQFNPRSHVSDEDLVELHRLLRTEPALPGGGDATAYHTDLLAARAILQASYGFDAANIGDDNGEQGW